MSSLDKKRESRTWQSFARIGKKSLLYAGVLWVIAVAALRFINPPLTPLIILRSVEYAIEDEPVATQWTWVPLADIPLHVQQTVVAAEDARFMDHWGIDLSALGDALDDSEGAKKPRGASTITMQTVKNIFLWPGRSYLRKVIEACMAPIAGALWGKRRTLELYLNVIEWGEGVYGIQAASEHYFGRSVNQLSLEQAASLAAILPSPRRLSPKTLSTVSRQRFDRIVREAPAVPLPTQFYSRGPSSRRRARS